MAQINVRFKEGPDHRTHHASGVWGGITPQREVVATFFFEQQAYPQGLVVQLDEQGRPTETERLGGGEMVRELLATVVMSPAVAHSVGQWLLEKAQAANPSPPPAA
ncbi:MAG: hypothetical protein COW73_10385 [Nitrospirae bacterium CG18_big_fil_WC_8_21_14_2_50_70_55]|nr:hypothetical protein [Deltaproteobacteria bacterium]OIP64289.1 MAG: hypothetical protein AUK30_06995 [Nitrospirae bacterium CG2_30_70_394]PIQ03667.1 MAG: hypothetical protein COW73_10385 [Nitrospirae bacterium CG18_big_fil_WC_8_21_14_2_50_70_55]PIU78073.1 MAG: hypothetical protein COS73_08335 [Nitrospirae bacterium CG06_land_8_20_14_3_00_70_43]PIX82322.1 MAG: hypothetical protein COZ33_11260 [Nitrospirae bacterium CG_4_10_14_3_um_filter_70_108]PJB95799.1 MAG: hypothetical protein CO080_0595